MALYKLYNGIEYIKDFFGAPPLASGPSSLAENDKRLLGMMHQRADFLTATDGKNYWYYIVVVPEYLELARILLARNGIRTNVHYSALNDGRVPVLRVPSAFIRERPDLSQFVHGIHQNYLLKPTPEIINEITAMRVQLGLTEHMRE